MRRDHDNRPFDVEAAEADDVTTEFWGSSRGWVSREHPAVDGGSAADASDELWSDDTTGSFAAIRDGVRAFRPQRAPRHDGTGEVQRTRQHGVVSGRQAAASGREASLGELADGWPGEAPAAEYEGVDPDAELIPLSPAHPLAERLGLGAVDPLLVRVGMVILIVVLLVPLALALRPSAGETIGAGTPQPAAALLVTGAPTEAADETSAEPTPSAPEALSSAAPAESSAAPDSVSSTVDNDADTIDAAAPQPVAADQPQSESESADDVGDRVQSNPSSNSEAATVSAAAERVVPECPTTYVAGAGDSWYRIADAAGVSPGALLDQNRATVQTVILPGNDICLPEGATMPAQPATTTAAPNTTEAPATTAPATTAPATTAPATTAPATTQAPASSGAVQQMIRDIWPDELEEKALQIAWRESNYKPNVYNGWCCYGVFQIYWTVHDDWLDNYGINSSSDLYDARKNITAAYALYQQAGGWGPWGG